VSEEKLEDFRILTLNVPAKQDAPGASWLVLPFISGFDTTTKAAPKLPPVTRFSPGEYYLIPVDKAEALGIQIEKEEPFDPFVADTGDDEKVPF
jgi:hypothetical protein